MKNFIMFLALCIGAQCQQFPRQGGGLGSPAAQAPTEDRRITPGAARQQLLLSLALHDWQAHEHLPFLPRLDHPVYIKPDSWLCNTGGELLNPHKPELVVLHECTALTTALRVQVIEPTDREEYVTDHMTGTVQVIYRSRNMSDGNVYGAWVYTKDLSN